MTPRALLEALPRRWAALPAWTGALIALLSLVLATTLRNPTFIGGENVLNVLRQWSFVGILALGMTFVMTLGGIDLSVGSLVAFAGGLGILVMNTALGAAGLVTSYEAALGQAGVPLPCGAFRYALSRLFLQLGLAGREGTAVALGFAVIVATGLLAGLLHGLLISRGRLAPFIATLGGLAGYRSLALALANGGEVSSRSPSLFKAIGTGGIALPGTNLAPQAPVPVPLLVPWPVLVFVVLAVLAHVLLNRTRYGRYVVAVGCNPRAAAYSAIDVGRVTRWTYLLMGFLAGVAALLLASRMNSVSSSGTGLYYELDVIAAVVIGGTSMSGGRGTVIGTVIGVLILGVVGNMLNLLQVSTYLQGLVKGLIIVVAVLMQRRPSGAA